MQKKKKKKETYNTINSTAFPKVTLVKAPTVSPIRLATHSVAWLRMPAKGMTAIAFRANTIVGFKPAPCAAIPAGTKTSNRLTQLWQIAVLVCRQKRMHPFLARIASPCRLCCSWPWPSLVVVSEAESEVGGSFSPDPRVTWPFWEDVVAEFSATGEANCWLWLRVWRVLREDGEEAWALAHEWIRSRR